MVMIMWHKRKDLWLATTIVLVFVVFFLMMGRLASVMGGSQVHNRRCAFGFQRLWTGKVR
jgi:hypothetical protein